MDGQLEKVKERDTEVRLNQASREVSAVVCSNSSSRLCQLDDSEIRSGSNCCNSNSSVYATSLFFSENGGRTLISDILRESFHLK